jgi:hypothetical protein
MALTSASAVHAARGPSPLTVMLIVGHGAGVSGEPRPGRPDAAGTQGHLLDGRLPTGCLETRGDPGQAEGCQPRQHPASQASAGGQAPGTSRRSPPVRSRSPGRSKMRLPSMSAARHAVTLSDTRRHGERAHCRRSVRAGVPQLAPTLPAQIRSFCGTVSGAPTLVADWGQRFMPRSAFAQLWRPSASRRREGGGFRLVGSGFREVAYPKRRRLGLGRPRWS